MESVETLVAELTSGDEARAEAAAHELGGRAAAALRALRPLLSEPDSDTRWWALRALAGLDLPEAAVLLCEGLGDPTLEVRQCAALGLRYHPIPEAVPALCEALLEEERLLGRLASDALVQVGSPAVLPLIELLDRAPPSSRVEIVRALALIADRRAIPALFNALDDPSALVEHWAEEGLTRMGIGMSYFRP